MPLATLHLVQLHSSPSALLSALRNDSTIHIILASIPQFQVIESQKLDSSILNQSWDLLILLTSSSRSTPAPSPTNLSNSHGKYIKAIYTLHVGIPSRLLSSYDARQADLLSSVLAANAQLTFSLSAAEDAAKSTSQNLELSPALLAFTKDFTSRNGRDQPVTMLNLLHFEPEGGKVAYAAYGRAFVDVAGRRGGDAKLVGNVVLDLDAGAGKDGDSSMGRSGGEWWNEFSLVHYPSLLAFCDMLAGEDYQEINRRYRLNALRDTVLICTKEIDIEDRKARL